MVLRIIYENMESLFIGRRLVSIRLDNNCLCWSNIYGNILLNIYLKILFVIICFQHVLGLCPDYQHGADCVSALPPET